MQLNAKAYLKKVGSIWEYREDGPHAIYSLNELHTDFYFNSDVFNESEEILDFIVNEYFIEELKPLLKKVDIVCSYLPYGAGITKAVANYLNCKYAFVENVKNPALNIDVKANERVLLVADDIYSGGSLKVVKEVVEKLNLKLIETIFAVGNFSGNKSFYNFPIISLIEMSVNRWAEKDCPLCTKGSIALEARLNWEKLVHKS